MTNPNNPSLSLDSEKETAGSIKFNIVGQKRNVKTYTILETEKMAYTTWNFLRNSFYNVAFSFLFFGAGLFTQRLFLDWNNISPFAKAVVYLGSSLSSTISVIFFIMAIYLSKKHESLDTIIENETKHNNT